MRCDVGDTGWGIGDRARVVTCVNRSGSYTSRQCVGWTAELMPERGDVSLPPARGDDGASALELVFRNDFARLVTLARFILDQPEEAEEVVQEAFVRAFAARDRLEQPDDPRGYVQRSVVNLARDGLRRRATMRRHPIRQSGNRQGVDAEAVLNESQREIVRAVLELPERQRACVAMRYLLEMSTAETAAALEISTGSVKTHLSRGLATLQTLLEAQR